MPLATLAQVKNKLRIPATDTSEDTAIQAVLDAAEQFVLAITGYSLVDSPVEEVWQQGQIGRVLYLRYRPVANVTAQARLLGNSNWTSVAIDIIDATQGIVALPGGAAWPPQPPTPRWFGWRQPAWDVVKIAYLAVALTPVPADLSDATAALAATWYRQQLAGPATDVTVGEVRESYSQLPIPPNVATVLARHERRGAVWQ